MKIRALLPISILLLALYPMSHAQTPPLPPESSQFDFWIGAWDVTDPSGKHVGENRIEKVEDGRGLLETWRGTGGSAGNSLNAYNAPKQRWQQYWVGAGVVLELEGGLDPQGNMVMSDRGTRAPSQKRINRITWTPNPDGTVRQHWEITVDDGASWKTAFDGLYRRKPSG